MLIFCGKHFFFLKIHLPFLLEAMKILTQSEHANDVLYLEEERDVTELKCSFEWLKQVHLFGQ